MIDTNFSWIIYPNLSKLLLLLVSPTTRLPLNEGQTVNLSCSLGPHSITPEVKWTCRSCSSHPFLRSTSHPANLSFPVRMEDNGEWRCELRKDQETLTSVKFSLRVGKRNEKRGRKWFMWSTMCKTDVVNLLFHREGSSKHLGFCCH